MNMERLHAIEDHQVYHPSLATSRIQQEKPDDFRPWNKSDSSSSLTRGSKIGKNSSLSNLSVGSADPYDNTLHEAINMIDQARFQRNRSAAVRTGRKLLRIDDTLHVRTDIKDTQSSENDNVSQFNNNLALFDSLPKQSLPSRNKKKSRSNEKRVAEISQIMKELKVCQDNISKFAGSSQEESSARICEETNRNALDRRADNLKSMEELFKACDDLLETYVTKRSKDSCAGRCAKNYLSAPNPKRMTRRSVSVASTGALARRRRSSVRFDLTQNEVFDI